MGKEERNTYTIQEEEIGQVQIADEVVAIIAGLAAMEVDGVSSMAGTSTRDLISKLGKKNLSKGVKVDVLDGVVTVSLSLNLRFGKNIMEVSSRVQEKVKAAIENMTGLSVADVKLIPQTTTELTDETQLKMMNKLVDMLEDDDDVQNVYHNWEIAE